MGQLTVPHASQWSEQMFSPFVIANQSSVAKVQLGDGKAILLRQITIVKHVDTSQAGIAVTRVPEPIKQLYLI